MLKCLSYTFFILYCLCPSELIGQNIISGKIYDLQKNPIELVNVLILKNYDSQVVTYGNTQQDGSYLLKTTEEGVLYIKFTLLGYASQTIQVEVKKGENTLPDIFLEEKSFELEGVIVRTEPPISQRKDTVRIATKYFTDGTEKNLEDLLHKIPGLRVEGDGTVKVGDREVEKIMVEGDDFFEKGYRMLSKSMPAHPIEEIEVLKRYSSNRLLKDIEESNKVALNLKINEKSKRIWFGTTDMAYGLASENWYHLKANLMNFGKKNKYYFLTNFNNVGDNSFASVQNLVNPIRFDESVKIGNNEGLSNLIIISPTPLVFKQIHSRLNNAELLSVNGIFNPTEKLKMKVQGFFNWDEVRFFQNTTDIVNANGLQFTNTENFQLTNKEKTVFGKLDASYDFSKTQMLQSSTQLSYGKFNDYTHLLFNGNSTIENLTHQNNFFDHKMVYTNKIKERKAFLITGRYIREVAPQNYAVNQYLFKDLFSMIDSANNVKQQVSATMQFAGINAFFINRTSKKHLLEVQLGNEFRNDELQSEFSVFQNNTLVSRPDDFQNQTFYQENNSYLKTLYTHHLSDSYKISGGLELHHFFNQLKIRNEFDNQRVFYINPNVNFHWTINENHKMNFSYSYNVDNAKTTDIYNGFVMTRFKSFTKGTSNFNKLDISAFTLNYSLGNWGNRLFANFLLIYRINHNFLSTNTFLEQNFSTHEKIQVKNREMLIFDTKIDYYFKKIATNLKLDLGYYKTNFKNKVNDFNWRVVNSVSYRYGFELRSAFRSFFNYNVGTKWNTSTMNVHSLSRSFTDNISFLDFTFSFKKITLKTQCERYFFGNLPSNQRYYFLDFEADYKIFDQKLTFSVTGKNIFKTQTFRRYEITDIGSTMTEYRLLPRFVLLRMMYRF